MKHFGDITKIDGHKVPLVDIVCGGSPCQDLSVAGKREGLAGARSGLFMEQIRVIKEMRDESIRQLRMRGADVDIRLIQPRYMVWENVPGAFSSNKGEDFYAVLEETAKIADENAFIPRHEGKWTPSGCILADGWSIAWRVHDAQFWGVPQRRKRISLVADFGGQSAPEILFERKGLSGDSEQSEPTREEVAGSIGTGVSQSDSAFTLKIRGGCERDSHGKTAGKGALVQTEKSGTLGVSQDQTLIQCINGNDVAGTLDASYYKGCRERQGTEREVVCIGNGQLAQAYESDKVGALNCMHDQQAIITYGLDRASFNQGQNAQFNFSIEEEIAPSLIARGPGGVLAKQ